MLKEMNCHARISMLGENIFQEWWKIHSQIKLNRICYQQTSSKGMLKGILQARKIIQERNFTSKEWQIRKTESKYLGTSLTVQWLRPWAYNAWGVGSIPGQGTKIPHAMWSGQIKKKKSKYLDKYCRLFFLNPSKYVGQPKAKAMFSGRVFNTHETWGGDLGEKLREAKGGFPTQSLCPQRIHPPPGSSCLHFSYSWIIT